MMLEIGDEAPIDRKTGNPTTGAKHLLAKVGTHPFYAKVLEHREVGTIKTRYVTYPVKRDGKIHPKYQPLPKSGRLSSVKPNGQNIAGNSELATEFRKVLIASTGCVLLRRDYSGIEALITGYLAADPLIERLATLGIHAWVVGNYLEMEMPDVDDPTLVPILDKIKADNPTLYKKFKTTLYMIFFGAGPKRIWEENRGVFESYTEAFRLRTFIRKLFPGLTRWQQTVVGQTRQLHYVRIPFNNNRWLWNIPGADAAKSIAQWPQGCAAGVIKQAMIRVDGDPLISDYLIQQVHDELVLDCPENTWRRSDCRLKHCMEQPIPELGGMVIATSRKVGKTL